MRISTSPRQSYREESSSGWSRVGTADVAFFLVKGILWLLAPILLGVMREPAAGIGSCGKRD